MATPIEQGWRGPRIVPEQIRSILVSRLRFMGDIILTTPLLAALRQNFPQARIGFLSETPYDQLLEHHPAVDELYSFRRGDDRDQVALLRSLRRKSWDVAIDLFGNPRSALLLYLSGARRRIGGDFRGRRLLYTHRILDRGERMTAIAYHLRSLAPLGLDAAPLPTHIEITPEEHRAARQWLMDKGYDPDRPLIGLHPGATWPAKRWFPERFAALAARLHDEQKQILFTMGPGEEQIITAIFKTLPFPLALPEALPLRRLAAVLAQLTLYVSNDCGPLHLAPAVGTKTVGIFGPGEPDIWFPYAAAAGHRLVYPAVDCSHCHRDLCPDMFCMQAIGVKDVLDQVHSALAE
ncbi:MAG TPA: glycosyltransferase family 9 protein [bacterium]|nr:glycosyltransferase family 9 protein [bacterium]